MYCYQASGRSPDKNIQIAVLSACNFAASMRMEVGSKVTSCGAAPPLASSNDGAACAGAGRVVVSGAALA